MERTLYITIGDIPDVVVLHDEGSDQEGRTMWTFGSESPPLTFIEMMTLAHAVARHEWEREAKGEPATAQQVAAWAHSADCTVREMED